MGVRLRRFELLAFLGFALRLSLAH